MELSPNSLLLLNKFDSVNQLTSISLPPPPRPTPTKNAKQKKKKKAGNHRASDDFMENGSLSVRSKV